MAPLERHEADTQARAGQRRSNEAGRATVWGRRQAARGAIRLGANGRLQAEIGQAVFGHQSRRHTGEAGDGAMVVAGAVLVRRFVMMAVRGDHGAGLIIMVMMIADAQWRNPVRDRVSVHRQGRGGDGEHHEHHANKAGQMMAELGHARLVLRRSQARNRSLNDLTSRKGRGETNGHVRRNVRAAGVFKRRRLCCEVVTLRHVPLSRLGSHRGEHALRGLWVAE